MVDILVAEDDENLNRLVCAALSAAGYGVCGCGDGGRRPRKAQAKGSSTL